MPTEEDLPSVACSTTKGDVEIVLKPEWSPLGVARFKELVENGHFTNMPLFRCVNNFLCQFGYKEEKPGEKDWSKIADDPKTAAVPKSFKQGYVSFAGNGANSRSSHLFVFLPEQGYLLV